MATQPNGAGRSFASNVSWNLLGNILYALSQWGMLVILSKLGSPIAVGQFTLALAVTAPIVLFTGLQLRNVQASDAKGSYQYSEYLNLRLLSTGASLLITVGIIVLGYSTKMDWIILVMCIAKCIESLSDMVFGLFQQRERMDYIGRSLIVKAAFSLAAVFLAMWLTDSVLVAVISLSMVWLLRLLFYDLRIARRMAGWRPLFNRQRLMQLTKLSLPLGIGATLASLNMNIPRYFIEYYGGLELLGYFAAMAYIIVVGNLVVNSLGQSLLARMSRYHASQDYKRFRLILLRLLLFCSALGTLGAVAVMIMGEQVLTLLYNANYAQYHREFLLIMVSAGIGFINYAFNYAFTAANLFKIQLPLNIAAISITIAANAMLIPDYGMLGAAYSLILAAVLKLLANLWIYYAILMPRQRADHYEPTSLKAG